MRLFSVSAAVAVALLAAGCTAGAGHRTASSAPPPASVSPSPSPSPDPHTAAALLRIASVFNRDYDSGNYAAVYARWDARSQAIISEADYIRRHRDCLGAAHAHPRTESVSPGAGGAWLVRYEIGGQQFTDYWFYVGRRWVFDLVLSNPDAVRLYRMSPRQYAAAVGCGH
jgi:hypothetical protein